MIRAVAKMGYQCVEFYAPYFDWSDAQARQMRKLLDELGIRCYSTHNDDKFFSAENINHARDLNLILGTKYMVWAYSDAKPTLDAWKAVADKLNSAAETLEPSGLRPGYHNHDAEWRPINGVRPMEILARTRSPRLCCNSMSAPALKPARSGGLDPREPGANSLVAFERLVIRSGQRVQGAVRRRGREVARYFRRGRKRRRGRVLPDRAGRQPLQRIGNSLPLPQDLQLHARLTADYAGVATHLAPKR